MGLFVLPLSETIDDNVKEAIANLKLYLERPDDEQSQCDYLLHFAEVCFAEAIRKCENNKKEAPNG